MAIKSGFEMTILKQVACGQQRKSYHSPTSGFSLVELMVAALAGVVLILGASQILISHIQTSSRIEARLRLQDTWSRLQFLLDQEIQEARSASISGSSLTLKVPSGSSGSATVDVVYSYSSSTKQLNRSGPKINSDGSLDFALLDPASLVTSKVSRFAPVLNGSGNQIVEYTVSLIDPSGAAYSNRSSASIGRPRIIN